MTSSRLLRQLNAVVVAMTISSSPFSTAAMFVAAGAWQRVSKEFHLMKKTLMCGLLGLAMAASGTALYAQMQQGSGPGGGMQRMGPMSADQRLQHLTQMLNLTSDQQAKIKPILETESQQMEALHSDTSMSREDRMAKMQSIHQATSSQITPILTSEQQQKWQQMQARHMRPGGAVPPNAVGGAAPQPQQ
jgi:Spy/CpxP family protein refolding chaperone